MTRPGWKEAKAEAVCARERLEALADAGRLSALDGVIAGVGLSVVSSSHHVFPNLGLTYVAILRESHLVLHTWPEFDLALIDLFVCAGGPDDRISDQVRRIAAWLPAERVTVKLVAR